MAYVVKKQSKPEPKQPKARTNNPWSEEGWSVAAQQKLIRSIGPTGAAGVAAAVGCTLTSTAPNPEAYR